MDMLKGAYFSGGGVVTHREELSGIDRKRSSLWKDEDHWQTITFTVAGISFAILLVVALFWVFETSKLEDVLKRVQILAPFALFAGASVTFCTVVWRGLISARQANINLEQLNGLRKQIVLTEETNIAQLLQKGAELIAEEGSAKVSAGIATLQAVAQSDNDKFIMPARMLLGDFVAQRGANSHESQQVQQAIKALNLAYKKHGTVIAQHIFFDFSDTLDQSHIDYATDWKVLFGFALVNYDGGDFYQADFTNVPPRIMSFSHITFHACIFKDLSTFHFRECTFDQCVIARAHTSILAQQVFNQCDFSDTIIVFNHGMPDLRPAGNYYLEDHAPRAIGNTGPHVKWSDVLDSFEELPDDNPIEDE